MFSSNGFIISAVDVADFNYINEGGANRAQHRLSQVRFRHCAVVVVPDCVNTRLHLIVSKMRAEPCTKSRNNLRVGPNTVRQ